MSRKEWINGLLIGVITGTALHQFNDKPRELLGAYHKKKENLYKEGKTQYEIVQASRKRIAVSANKNASERRNEHETKKQ